MRRRPALKKGRGKRVTRPRGKRPPSKPVRARRRSEIDLDWLPGPVRILFLDCDGVLTDGTIGFDRDGDSRTFFIRDGIALEWARGLDVLPVVISGRGSKAVEGRMHDLGLEYYLGVKDKVAVAARVLDREGVDWGSCAMIGDDLPDVPLLKKVGWPIAVGDARPEVQRAAKTVMGAPGGKGAVRDAVEMILRHNGTWELVLDRYEAR